MEIQFTDREIDVMDVLWERGPSLVAEVRAALRDELAYTTVLTILRTLEGKGHVSHEQEGRFAIVMNVGGGMRWPQWSVRRALRGGRRSRVDLTSTLFCFAGKERKIS